MPSVVSSQVHMAASMKTIVCWDVSPCSLVLTERRFRGTCYLHTVSHPRSPPSTYKHKDGRNITNFIQAYFFKARVVVAKYTKIF